MKKIFITLAVIGVLVVSCKKDKDKAPPTAPLVQTGALTNVAASLGTATAGGSIVSDGGEVITQSGVVWSKTNATPALSDNTVASTATTGAFTVDITGIDFGQTYYFRAFATNSVGTGYGDVVTLTTSNDSVRFTYNGQTVTYGIITSPTTGKKWLDRNLGAQQVATAYDDYKAYGDLFQWGRPADGHQLFNWISSIAGSPVNGGTTMTVANSDIPGHGNFIIVPHAVPYDWCDDNNSQRWVTNPRGPCPEGWHVPTLTEWRAEGNDPAVGGTPDGIRNRIEAYNKLKITVVGFRLGSDNGTGTAGQIFQGANGPGNIGTYWCSTDYINVSYTNGDRFRSGPDHFDDFSMSKCHAAAVRCIKD